MTHLEERNFMNYAYLLLTDSEKNQLADILLRQQHLTLDAPVRQRKEELERRDNYFLCRVVKKAQRVVLTYAIEEQVNLKKITTLKRKEALSESDQYWIGKREEDITKQSIKMMNFAFEAYDAVKILTERGENALLEEEVLPEYARPIAAAMRPRPS